MLQWNQLWSWDHLCRDHWGTLAVQSGKGGVSLAVRSCIWIEKTSMPPLPCFDAHEIFVPKLFPANPLLCRNICMSVNDITWPLNSIRSLWWPSLSGTQSFSLCYLLLLTQLTSWGALNETQTLPFLIVWDNISAEVTKGRKRPEDGVTSATMISSFLDSFCYLLWMNDILPIKRTFTCYRNLICKHESHACNLVSITHYAANFGAITRHAKPFATLCHYLTPIVKSLLTLHDRYKQQDRVNIIVRNKTRICTLPVSKLSCISLYYPVVLLFFAQ